MDKIIHISSFYLETDVNENYKPHIASQNKMYVANGRITSDIKKISLPTFIRFDYLFHTFTTFVQKVLLFQYCKHTPNFVHASKVR